MGGTGKSPLVIALIEHLRSLGYRPGVVSRGYGANPPAFPYHVTVADGAACCGDEPLMLVQRTGVELVIDPDRVRACRYLLERGCDVLISDDGLQHYRMGRTLEIAVIDAGRGLGNGHCLPLGPLREPGARLQQVDLIIANGPWQYRDYSVYQVEITPQAPRRLTDDTPVDTTGWPSNKVHALAGIGAPQRFFHTLRQLQFEPIEHVFPDHHPYLRQEITFPDPLPVIMTEKDAVKCRPLVSAAHYYYLPISVQLGDALTDRLNQLLQSACE